ncbi:MAG: DNA-3-methyladenine glycosylase family protein [Niabella sp.]
MPYKKQLRKDPVMKGLVQKYPLQPLVTGNNILQELCSSIVGQQLSIKAAATINSRFLQLFNGKKPKAAHILAVPDQELRNAGLSNAKVTYVKNVCRFFIEQKLTDAKLHIMSDDDLLALLTQIKGVGKWTVEMVLMFVMGRQNVFSTGDLVLQKAMILLYNIEYLTKKELEQKMLNISNTWSPYKTYACLYLWKSIDVEE